MARAARVLLQLKRPGKFFDRADGKRERPDRSGLFLIATSAALKAAKVPARHELSRTGVERPLQTVRDGRAEGRARR